jgi:hypothetical protein
MSAPLMHQQACSMPTVLPRLRELHIEGRPGAGMVAALAAGWVQAPALEVLHCFFPLRGRLFPQGQGA